MGRGLTVQTDDETIADVLGQVVELGHTAQEIELGEAISRHIQSRPPATTERGAPGRLVVTVNVDFNELLAEVGEVDTYRIIAHLKDLLGGNP